MPFDWREFLLVAHALRNQSGEGFQRTCLGRGYYFVYNLGLIRARSMNFSGQIPGLHRKLWNWCPMHTDPLIRQMGVDGLRMHSLRISADYDGASIPNLAREVKTQLSKAEAFERLTAQVNGQAPPVRLGP